MIPGPREDSDYRVARPGQGSVQGVGVGVSVLTSLLFIFLLVPSMSQDHLEATGPERLGGPLIQRSLSECQERAEENRQWEWGCGVRR